MRMATESLCSGNSVNTCKIFDNGVFDFEKFCIYMKKCITEVPAADDVELGSYLEAYGELYNFFLILGGAFQFVASDVKCKIQILTEFRNNELKKSNTVINFSTVKTMIKFEKEEKLLENSKYVSGSRTLLRLHRDFIRRFLHEIYKLDDDVQLGCPAREIYDQTLGEYHTWIVRNTARVAMKFLPSRKELLSKISQNNEENLHSMLNKFPEVLKTVNLAYDRIQLIFSDNCLLNLP